MDILRNGDFEDGSAFWELRHGATIGSEGCDHGQCLHLPHGTRANHTDVGAVHIGAVLAFQYKYALVEPVWALPRIRIILEYAGGFTPDQVYDIGFEPDVWKSFSIPVSCGCIRRLFILNASIAASPFAVDFYIDDATLDNGISSDEKRSRFPEMRYPPSIDYWGPENNFGMMKFLEQRMISLEGRLVDITNELKALRTFAENKHEKVDKNESN